MPVEAVRPIAGQQVRTVMAATPPRLRPKGPVGPDFYRQNLAAAKGQPKQSAVERLEADKAKYVKSQVALSKQQPVRPPELRKPLLTTQSAALRPTRKTQPRPLSQHGNVPLDLEHLSNLINDVNDVHDGPTSSTTASSAESQPTAVTDASSSPCLSAAPASVEDVEEKPCSPLPPPCPDFSSPAKVRLKASCPTKAEGPGCTGSPTAVTIRRVDVIPSTRPARSPCRPQQYMRQPLHPMPLHSQFILHPPASNTRLFNTRTIPGPLPLKPVSAPPPPHNHSPTGPAGASAAVQTPDPPSPSVPRLPPSSPAVTRLSSSSSRKRPSLTRSKSDMSDRFSRAGTELERFFNLCGLDPSDLQGLTGSCSDIVSISRLRSASAPGSECAGSIQKEDEEDGAEAVERIPYGVSVIEKNARVIKWLYGIRQAKDHVKSTNL